MLKPRLVVALTFLLYFPFILGYSDLLIISSINKINDDLFDEPIKLFLYILIIILILTILIFILILILKPGFYKTFS